MMNKGKLYMLPVPIGDTPVRDVLPETNLRVIGSLEYFIVENVRSARRFLSRAGIDRPIDTLRFAELNEHTPPAEVEALLVPVLEGCDAGVISEAGVPGVADPGADVVALAHRHGIEGQSQLFIEAPYRNLKLFEDFVGTCSGDTKLCVAADILQPDQFIRTAFVREWKGHAPDIHKRPAIFILGT